MNVGPRCVLRATLTIMALSIIASACSGTSDGVVSPGELRVNAVDNSGEIPPWEEFVVEVAPIVAVEQVTAIGDPDENGNSPIGTSCAELEFLFPDLTGCREEVGDTLFERQDPIVVGMLESDGTLVLPAPDTDASVTLSAVNPADELCFFTGVGDYRPGEAELVIFIEQVCA